MLLQFRQAVVPGASSSRTFGLKLKWVYIFASIKQEIIQIYFTIYFSEHKIGSKFYQLIT